MLRAHAVGLALVATGVLGLGACSNAPAKGQCEKLLSHVIELELNANQVADGEREAKGKALREEIGERFLTRCNKELPASQVTCGLAAKTSADMEKCDK